MANANALPHVLFATTVDDLRSIHVAPLQDGVRVWVSATQESYYLSRVSPLVVDGVTVIAPLPGAAVGAASAKWLIGSIANGDVGCVSVNPAMTWHEIIAVQAVAAAAAGQSLCFSPGTYTANTKERLPNGPLEIVLGPKVRIVQTLTPDGDPFTAAFAAGEGAVGVQTTLTSNAPQGTSTIDVLAAVPVGSIIRINAVGAPRQFHAATRVVTNVAGPGPFVLTLDEPLLEPFFINEDVSVLASVPTDIHIDGRGARMSGTGQRYVEIAGGWRCLVHDIVTDTLNGVPDEILFSMDVGGRNNTYYNLWIDAGGNALIGLAMESQNRSVCENISVKSATTYGIAVWDSCLSDVLESSAFECTLQGIQIGGDTNTTGSFQCKVERSSGNASGKGITVLSGSTGTEIIACAAEGNTSQGLDIAGDGTTVAATRVVGGTFTNNNIGIHIEVGGGSTELVEPDVTGNVAYGLFSEAEFTAGGLITRGGAANNEIAIAAGRATIHRLTLTGTTNVNLVLVAAGARLTLVDPGMDCPALSNGIAVTGGTLDCKGGRIAGAANGITVVGGIARIADTDTASSGPAGPPTGVVASAGGQLSFGTLVLNGAVPVVVNFGDIRDTDSVNLQRQANGGAPGFWTVTIQPGASFTVTGTAGDTSTLAYNIE